MIEARGLTKKYGEKLAVRLSRVSWKLRWRSPA